MATGTKRGKAGSGAGVKTGKRQSKARKASLRDLDAKDTKSVRGGLSCAAGVHIKEATITSR